MDKIKIAEIFESTQGEGFNTGLCMIFIRLYGCNLHCSFCDSPPSKYTPEEMSPKEILKKIKRYKTKRVCITGGEPFIQDISELLKLLKENNYWVAVESNGTKSKRLDENRHLINWLTISPKTKLHSIIADEVKFIVGNGNIASVIPRTAKIYTNFIFVQPESNKKKYIRECLELIKKVPTIRLSLQTQKFINIR